ncbi:hypothetical protein ACFX13_008944 [Malus domestica]
MKLCTFCNSIQNPSLKFQSFLLIFSATLPIYFTESKLQTSPLIIPLKTQQIPSGSFPKSPNKLPFHHKVTLTVIVAVGTPPQNVLMVIKTRSELSWLHCNKTRDYNNTFDPTQSTSYSPVPCFSSTCTNRTDLANL